MCVIEQYFNRFNHSKRANRAEFNCLIVNVLFGISFQRSFVDKKILYLGYPSESQNNRTSRKWFLICSQSYVLWWASHTFIAVIMVLILDGNSEHDAHAYRKTRLLWFFFWFCDCCRSKRKPYTDQMTDFTPYMRTYFWATILYIYRAYVDIISFLCPPAWERIHCNEFTL